MSDECEFEVAEALQRDVGRDRVRIHYSRRDGAKRFVILRLQGNGTTALVSALGHESDVNIIRMDYDLRSMFGVNKGEKIRLKVSRAGLRGKLCWYLSATDPAVHIPAWLATLSVCLGAIGVVLGGVSLW